VRIRVVTFNVWNTEGDPRRLDLINRELRHLAPDLVALQEVVQTDKERSLPRLLDRTGLHGTHQADLQSVVPPFSDRYGGSAVASRWPHKAVEVLDLRLANAADVPWATLAVVVDLPGEGELLFIAATAAWRSNAEAARERQAMAIADLDARHRRALPTVIAGDFNAGPEAASIRYLMGRQSLGGWSAFYQDAWSIAGEGAGNTFARQPGHRERVDYVFVGGRDAHPTAHARVRSAALCFDQPIDGVCLSDHFGVLVDLDVDKGD
jgi:endonuclease/exonuclease/phosphatase family metal-dependent hydrolase